MFNVAALVKSLAFVNINTIPSVRTLLSVPTGLATVPFDAALCAVTTPGQTFVCPATNIQGMTFTTSYTLQDGSGNPVAQPTNANVAGAHFVRDGKGTVFPASNDASTTQVGVNDHSDIVADGLAGAASARTLHGTTATHYDVLYQGTTVIRSSFDFTTTVIDVVLPPVTATTTWPVSGTVTSDTKGVTMNGGVQAPNTTIHAVLKFNGTSTPTIVTTVAGSSLSCRVDLSGASSVPVCP
jgi:hypothetical protein